MAIKEKLPIKSSSNLIKFFLESFKTYWGYFMTFVAATAFIWSIGVKSERNTMERESVKTDIIQIKSLQSGHSKKVDQIVQKIITMETNQVEIVHNQNSLRNSYVKFIVNFDEMRQNGLSPKQFIEYMNGIQFSIPIIDTTMYNEMQPIIRKTPQPIGEF